MYGSLYELLYIYFIERVRKIESNSKNPTLELISACMQKADNAFAYDSVREAGFLFPDVHFDGVQIASLALIIKDEEKACHCRLPLCHTVEAEAMGGNVNFGDINIAPRTGDYRFTDLDDLLRIPDIDFTEGRIAEVLRACRILGSQGVNVSLSISGPISIINGLIDMKYFFKALIKNKELALKILDKIRGQLVAFVHHASGCGVRVFNYSDPPGDSKLLGQKSSMFITENFVIPLFNELESFLSDGRLMVLCPKTTYDLLLFEYAQLYEISLGEPMKYTEAFFKVIDKANFIGEACVKNNSYTLKEGIIKGIKLI